MKNILYLHAGAEMYGADKILLELVSGLDKERFRPIVVLPTDGPLVSKLKSAGISTFVIKYPILRRKYFNPRGIYNYVSSYQKACKQIIELLDEQRIAIDLIHVNTLAVLEGIMLKKKLNARLIWHVHEILERPTPIAKLLACLVNKYADKVVAVSQAVKKHLVSFGKVDSSKIAVVYNGVDTNQFSPTINTDSLRKEWNIPSDSINVGVIGRINAWKGQNDFLEALTSLLNEYSNLYLFVVGSAFSGQEWRVKELKEKIKNYNSKRIIYSEFRTDNNAVQSLMDILVLPSTNPDPLPTVVLEAMASGNPVVSYKHGGAVEMIKDGETGLLAKVCDTSDLQSKVKILLENQHYINFGKAARLRVEKEFSLDAFWSNFENIYTQI